MQIKCKYIYTYNQIAVYSVNKKVNLKIDLKNLINISLVLLIFNCLGVFFNKMNKNQ